MSQTVLQTHNGGEQTTHGHEQKCTVDQPSTVTNDQTPTREGGARQEWVGGLRLPLVAFCTILHGRARSSPRWATPSKLFDTIGDQPGGHGDGAADPLTQKLPGGQAPVQLAFVMDSAPPNRPAGQLAGVTEPASQYDPTGHGRMHSSGRPNVSLNLPAGQALQLAAPPRLNLPCGH